MLDRLIKISSLSGAFLIFCGVLKLIIYYSAFNIDVIDFLSLSEITKSFLDDINIIIVFGFLMLVQSLIVLNYLKKKTNLGIEQILENLLRIIYNNKWKYIIFFLSCVSLISILLHFDVLKFNYFIIYLLIFCVIQLLTFILLSKNEENEIDIPLPSITILIFGSIICSIFLFAKHDIQVTNQNQSAVTITTSDSTIVCNKLNSLIYIGKTDNFIFVKSEIKKSSFSIPVSSVKLLEFK